MFNINDLHTVPFGLSGGSANALSCLVRQTSERRRYRGDLCSVVQVPSGIKGEEVPVEARIVRVADVFASLVEERPFEVKRAMEIIKELSGTKLDMDSARILQQLVDEGVPVL